MYSSLNRLLIFFLRKIHSSAIYNKNLDKQFKCKVCLKELKSIGCLTMHELNTHREKKTEKCQDCDAKFLKKSLLVEHVNVKHKGGRYRCPYAGCVKKFQYRHHVGRHLRTIHNLFGDEYQSHLKHITITYD